MNDKEIALELTKFILEQKVLSPFIETTLDEINSKNPLEFAKEVSLLYNTIYKELISLNSDADS